MKMCLYKVTKTRFNKKTREKVYIGYKVFDSWYNSLYNRLILGFMRRKYNGSSIVKLDKWLTSRKTTKIIANDGNRYVPGFHIYTKRKDAEDVHRIFTDSTTIVKVRYTGVLAKGFECDYAVTVARKMLVMR
jgi:hypothetical protein